MIEEDLLGNPLCCLGTEGGLCDACLRNDRKLIPHLAEVDWDKLTSSCIAHETDINAETVKHEQEQEKQRKAWRQSIPAPKPPTARFLAALKGEPTGRNRQRRAA